MKALPWIALGLLVLILVGLVLHTRHCVDEDYIIPRPHTPEGDAALLQKTFLPDADTLSEEGGGYAIEQGIESPTVSPADDPWLRRQSYL
jgi:hypothetical protein